MRTRFILIDPSLQQPGGHNLEYALHLLRAARTSGYQVFLATHRNFPHARSKDMDWPVLPLFRFSLYRTRPIEEAPAPGHFWRDHAPRRQLKQFLQDCERLFGSLALAHGDICFLPMLSGFELAALINFLSGAPWTQGVFWCVQFHYAPLQDSAGNAGRRTDQQQTLHNYFSNLVARVPNHRLHFFATTERIAAQFRGLGLTGTRALPYPADPAIQPGMTGAIPSSLNLVLAGHLRREKGPHHLTGVVEALWRDFLARGRVHLWLQGRRGAIRRLLPRHIRPQLSEGDPAGPSAPVCRVAHPLSTEAYRDHILNAQIGLMLYDRRAYYARCSGALVEFLCAGVPVVVPAGTWLADQIAELIYRHHESLLADNSPRRWISGILKPRTGTSDGHVLSVGGPHGHLVTEAEMPQGAKALVIQCLRDATDTDGIYLRVDTEFPGDGPLSPDRQSVLMGHRAAGPVSAMFRCGGKKGNARLTWSTDTLSTPLHLRNIRLFFLVGGSTAPPLGAVGLIATDPAHAADCVADIVEHYSHYRETARNFAGGWRQRHSPQALLHTLEETASRG